MVEVVFVVGGIEIGFFVGVHFASPLPALVAVDIWCANGGCGVGAVIGEEGVFWVGIGEHLFVTKENGCEGFDVGYLGEAGAIFGSQVGDYGFGVLTFDVFEEFEAGGVEEVVSRHGLVNDVEDRSEMVSLDHLVVVTLVLQSDALAEKLQRS